MSKGRIESSSDMYVVWMEEDFENEEELTSSVGSYEWCMNQAESWIENNGDAIVYVSKLVDTIVLRVEVKRITEKLEIVEEKKS